MDGRTHTAIIVHICGSCNTVTLNTCYTDTVESIDGYIFEHSVSVMAVPELIVGKVGWQSIRERKAEDCLTVNVTGSMSGQSLQRFQ